MIPSCSATVGQRIHECIHEYTFCIYTEYGYIQCFISGRTELARSRNSGGQTFVIPLLCLLCEKGVPSWDSQHSCFATGLNLRNLVSLAAVFMIILIYCGIVLTSFLRCFLE